MTKDELRALAALGVREKIATIERELERLFAEFPDVFAGDAVPILLRAEMRAKGNGWKPEHVATVSEAVARGHKRAWTPERRAKYSRTMKARIKKSGHPRWKGAKEKRAPGKRAKGGAGANWKAKWYDRLEAHGPETVGASAAALGTSSASLLTSSREWVKAGAIVKQGKPGTRGAYAVGGPRPE